MDDWSEETLYNKAKLFYSRADEEGITSELYPFWASLALELLCRAALASIHPVLLADPREPDNIFYACGISIKKKPKSISAKTVFLRCQTVVKNYDKYCLEFCLLLSERRNSELHSGEAAFTSFNTGNWLSDYYHVVIRVLEFLGKENKDFLGESGAGNASKMLEEEYEKKKSKALKAIHTHKEYFESLDEEEKDNKRVEAEKHLLPRPRYSRDCECPSCNSKGLIVGELSDYGAPKIGKSSIEMEARIRPTAFICKACDLKLSGYSELKAAKLGDIFTYIFEEEPHEFFDIDIKDYITTYEIEKMYHEMHYDYGND